ncbi:MAG: PEP-CTERM sorting domain-containing protein [Phycisphaerales bacterium]|nr:PEP-CTERM sorting domain-containing protein [Phycisphaerales bacterium]
MRKFMLLMAGLGLSAAAAAQTWDETTNGGGDAGDLPATAQVTTGAGPLSTITGSITSEHADMYKILICDEGRFSATTVGGASWDTELFLFDANGAGVTFSDDSASTTQSTLTSNFVVANGVYFLAVSRYDRDPVNAAGAEIWADTPFATERAPDGPGAGNPIPAGWNSTATTAGNYSIALTGACFVPEPTSAILLALGSLAFARRR